MTDSLQTCQCVLSYNIQRILQFLKCQGQAVRGGMELEAVGTKLRVLS